MDVAAYKKRLRTCKTDPRAYLVVGVDDLENGNTDAALYKLHEARKLAPKDPQVSYHLGLAYMQAGDDALARTNFERALKYDSIMPAANINLGNLLEKAGDYESSVNCYARALQGDPISWQAHCNLATALFELGYLSRALRHAQIAGILAPDRPEPCLVTGNTLSAKRKLRRALKALKRGIKLDPEDSDLYAALSRVYMGLFRPDDAKVAVEKAKACQVYGLGTLLAEADYCDEMGDTDRALGLYRGVLSAVPNHAGALLKLGLRLKGKIATGEYQGLVEVSKDLEQTESNRSMALFGLGAVEDSRGRYAEAAEALTEGNRIRKGLMARRGISYNREAVEQLVAKQMQQTEGSKSDLEYDEPPIFIVGLPRSGTSLVENILGSHSRTEPLGERGFGEVAHKAFKKMPDEPVMAMNKINRKAGNPFIRWIDKMPGNFMYLNELYRCYPNATFIHCQRDIRDTAISCHSQIFQSISWSCDWDDIIHYFGQYARLMNHYEEACPWLKIHDIPYEYLVAEPEKRTRDLLEWCGLPFEEACLSPHKATRQVRTASAGQVREKIYTRSLDRYKHYEDIWGEHFSKLEQL